MGDTNKKTKKILSILLVIFIVFALGFLAWSSKDIIKKFFGFATVYDAIGTKAVTEGWTTNSGSYAWGENIGWVDFAPSAGNVYIADNALWGYAYGENVGWISLNCANEDGACASSNFKVTNDGAGNLSGYAYGENIGWINFGSATSTYQVKINASGNFTGYAWGENVGWISFNSANGGSISYKVSTNWRHQSDRPACNNGLDDDSDGLIDYPADRGCHSKTGTTEKSGSTNSEDTNAAPMISVVRPIAGTQWTAGNTYKITWEPISTTTDTYIYMVKGGYGDDYRKLLAFASSTDSFMDYYVTDADLPKIDGANWNIAVCTGEVVNGDTSTCGFSGDFYINYAGKKVESKSTTTPSDNNGSGGNEVINLPPIQTVTLPVIKLEPIKLVELPKFGTESKDSFTFVPPIKSFLFAPLPEDISNALSKFPKLRDYLASVGFATEQDLIRLNVNRIYLSPLPEPLPTGLFVVSRDGNNIRTQLASDENYKVVQLVRVASGTPITISLIPVGTKVVGEWNGEKIPFIIKNGLAVLEFNSDTPGRYILTTDSSPLPLAIEVLEKTQTNTQSTAQAGAGGWISRVLGLFGR